MAYVLPIVISLGVAKPRIDRKDGTRALIIVPTRELSCKSLRLSRKYRNRTIGFPPGSIHGGENRAKEKAKLRKGCIVLSATPGRLLDHLQNTAAFMYVNVSFIVFDEADRVLDLGFEKDIEAILDIIDRTKKGGTGGIVVASIFTNDVIVGYVDARYGTFANENAKCGDSGRKP